MRGDTLAGSKRTVSANKIRHMTVVDVIEEWRPVGGFEGHYEVSNLGRVRSIDRVLPWKDWHSDTRFVRGQIRKPHLVKGYPSLGLNMRRVRTKHYVHTLVCEAFHGPRPSGYEVRHLNGDEMDNRAENLAWGTHSENVRDQVRHGRHRYAKTHCKWGHEYTPENTDTSRGHQLCLTCRKRRNAETHLRRRVKKAAR